MNARILTVLVVLAVASLAVAVDPKCQDEIKDAKAKDDAAEVVLENANKAFNATLKQADATVAKAVSDKTAADTALDKAQDAANSARFQMDQKNNEFNNAVLHLEDTIQLCNTPQPPSGCDHTLEEAQANVKSTNTTYQKALTAYTKAQDDQKAKQTALEDAEHAYTTAISQKDDQIRGAEGQIQAAVAAKGKTAEAYADIVRQCAPHLDRRGGGGGAEQRRGYHL